MAHLLRATGRLDQALADGYGIDLNTISAVIEYGHKTLGVEKIVGLTAEHNTASIGILTKLGLSFERMVKMSDDDPGTALYS